MSKHYNTCDASHAHHGNCVLPADHTGDHKWENQPTAEADTPKDPPPPPDTGG